MPDMEKNLTVYPISSGDELNIFANQQFEQVRILDMAGNIMHDVNASANTKYTINIKTLPKATYIVEVIYNDRKKGRSVFVKT